MRGQEKVVSQRYRNNIHGVICLTLGLLASWAPLDLSEWRGLMDSYSIGGLPLIGWGVGVVHVLVTALFCFRAPRWKIGKWIYISPVVLVLLSAAYLFASVAQIENAFPQVASYNAFESLAVGVALTMRDVGILGLWAAVSFSVIPFLLGLYAPNISAESISSKTHSAKARSLKTVVWSQQPWWYQRVVWFIGLLLFVDPVLFYLHEIMDLFHDRHSPVFSPQVAAFTSFIADLLKDTLLWGGRFPSVSQINIQIFAGIYLIDVMKATSAFWHFHVARHSDQVVPTEHMRICRFAAISGISIWGAMTLFVLSLLSLLGASAIGEGLGNIELSVWLRRALWGYGVQQWQYYFMRNTLLIIGGIALVPLIFLVGPLWRRGQLWRRSFAVAFFCIVLTTVVPFGAVNVIEHSTPRDSSDRCSNLPQMIELATRQPLKTSLAYDEKYERGFDVPIDLPFSADSNDLPRDGTLVEIYSHGIRSFDAPLVDLLDGLVFPIDLDNDGEQLILPLFNQWKNHVSYLKELASRTSREYEWRLLLLADRNIPIKTYKQVAFTAHMAGASKITIVAKKLYSFAEDINQDGRPLPFPFCDEFGGIEWEDNPTFISNFKKTLSEQFSAQDKTAWRLFENGMMFWQDYGSAVEARQMFEQVVQQFPQSRWTNQSRALVSSLKSIPSRAYPQEKDFEYYLLSPQEQLRFLEERLQDLNCYQRRSDIPVSVFVHCSGFNAAEAFRSLKKDAIPVLVKLLKDDRLTQTVGFPRAFRPERYVVRYQDAALEILEAIVDKDLFPNEHSLLSKLSKKKQDKAVKQIVEGLSQAPP